jgi:hypothetical protein
MALPGPPSGVGGAATRRTEQGLHHAHGAANNQTRSGRHAPGWWPGQSSHKLRLANATCPARRGRHACPFPYACMPSTAADHTTHPHEHSRRRVRFTPAGCGCRGAAASLAAGTRGKAHGAHNTALPPRDNDNSPRHHLPNTNLRVQHHTHCAALARKRAASTVRGPPLAWKGTKAVHTTLPLGRRAARHATQSEGNRRRSHSRKTATQQPLQRVA